MSRVSEAASTFAQDAEASAAIERELEFIDRLAQALAPFTR